MKLYKKIETRERGSDPTDPTLYYSTKDVPASLSDIRKALAEHGMVAVSTDVNDINHFINCFIDNFMEFPVSKSDMVLIIKAMIQAAQKDQE